MKTDVLPRIAIISVADDAHIEYVAPYLKQKYIVIDTHALLDGAGLSFAFKGGKATTFYDGVSLSDIQAVWYRKPQAILKKELEVPDNLRDYAASALQQHSNSLLSVCGDAFWVSDYFSIIRACSKPWQLEEAARLGLRVPDTLATSDQSAARRFLEAHTQVIVKSQAVKFPPIAQGVFPATRVTKPLEISLEGLHKAPAIFQQAINTVGDVRITVVGSDVFAAAVHDTGLKRFPAVRDWRMGYAAGKTKFVPFALPAAIRKQCVLLVERLGLQFGAIDMVQDERGRLWFLEINPNGQWAFIEEDTGLPIGRSLAALLERRTPDTHAE